jgi:hypothetical protein
VDAKCACSVDGNGEHRGSVENEHNAPVTIRTGNDDMVGIGAQFTGDEAKEK